MLWLILRRFWIWTYLAAFAVGLIAFLVVPTPIPWTPALSSSATSLDDGGRVNWAALDSGGRVRASGYDHFRSHHPLYLIDGEANPTGIEKWASLSEEPTPWLEISLEEPRDLDEVVIYHAGWKEQAAFTNDRYTIRCFAGEDMVFEVGVLGNGEAIARHPVDCAGTDRIWVAFDCSSGLPDVARIYEIQAWGVP